MSGWDIFRGYDAMPIWEWVERATNPPAPDPCDVLRERERRMDAWIRSARPPEPDPRPYHPPGPLQPLDHILGCRCPVCEAWDQHKKVGRR
jgi:hypothetical protein